MSFTIDPTVPVSSESVGNADVRIQNVASWLLQLIGQPGNAAFTTSSPFTVDGSGNVNIVNSAGFKVGGSPLLATTQLYKGADQAISAGVATNDSVLTLPIASNENWAGRFVLFTSGGASRFTVAPQAPAGATWGVGISQGVQSLVAPGPCWISSGSLNVLGINGYYFYEFPFTVNNGATSGNFTLQYDPYGSSLTIKAVSHLFAFQVST